jgi:hypothetical protein
MQYFLTFRDYAFADESQHFGGVPFQRCLVQGVSALIRLREIAGRTKVETAQAHNIESAVPGIHLPALACRDTPLEQRLNPGVEGGHSELAKVLAPALDAFQHEDSGRQGFLCHRGE